MNIYWNLETSYSRFSWITFSEVGNGNISIRLWLKERKKERQKQKKKKERKTKTKKEGKKIFFMICHVNTGNEIKKKNLVIIIEISFFIAIIKNFFSISPSVCTLVITIYLLLILFPFLSWFFFVILLSSYVTTILQLS